MKELENIGVFNQKIVALSAYKRPVPEGKRYQYKIQMGNYPHISLYVESDFLYNNAKEAHTFAERELIRRGVDPMKARIFTQRRNKSETKA